MRGRLSLERRHQHPRVAGLFEFAKCYRWHQRLDERRLSGGNSREAVGKTDPRNTRNHESHESCFALFRGSFFSRVAAKAVCKTLWRASRAATSSKDVLYRRAS